MAGQAIKAGTYTMFAIPDENKWTIILNAVANQWGAYDYSKNKDKDVVVYFFTAYLTKHWQGISLWLQSIYMLWVQNPG